MIVSDVCCLIIQESQQLKDQLHEKIKENKRIKENFDTLKMANDTLSKEVCRNVHIA